jgi:parallel beta-helix repeat protein
MKYISKYALAIAAILAAVAGSTPATAQTSVSACGQILSKPGQYVLSTDLDCSGTFASGVSITSSDVVFHLANHTITSQDCDLSKDIDGISAQGPLTGIRIDGGTVRGFNDGIVLSSSHSQILGMTVTNACTFGIALQGDHNRVQSSLVTGNLGYGIGLQVSTSHVISGNEISNNSSGIGLSNHANNNLVVNNRIHENTVFGVLINFGTSNVIKENELDGNSVGIELQDSGNAVLGNIVNASLNTGIGLDAPGPNTVKKNAVYGSVQADMSDANVGCAADTWAGNAFATDLVDAVPDGGPKSGCIR